MLALSRKKDENSCYRRLTCCYYLMKYQDSSAQANQKMSRCLEYLQLWQLPPNPINFAVGYEYVGGKNVALISAIKQELQQKNALDPFFVESAYKDYVLGQSKFRETIVDDIDNIITSISTDCNASNQVITDFTDTLDTSLIDLTQGSMENVSKVAAKLKQASQLVKHSQNKLIAQLAAAKKQSDKLQSELSEVRREIFMDPLTGFYNRRAMQQHVDTWFSDQPDKQLAAIILDIDGFKKFNDNFGTLIGDVILSKVAGKVKGYVDKSGLPVRLGGEEFVIILPDVETSIASEIAEKIRLGVEKLRFVSAKSRTRLPQVTISLGVTAIKAGENIAQCIARAETALMSAKQRGCNQVAVA